MQFVKVCLEQLLLPQRRVPVSACMVVPSPRTLTWEKLGAELSLQRRAQAHEEYIWPSGKGAL